MDRYVEGNRALWDEWARINAGSAFYDVESFKRGGTRLRDYEIEEVGPVEGKDLLHLQCHFGLDTLSWARLGATVTGADFSEEGLRIARELADELGLEARFVHSDVADLPSNLQGDFDVVYTSRGAICWLPDLPRWAEVIAHFLRPGGVFYITEAHPVMWALDDDEGVTEPRLRYPYFSRPEPITLPTQGSYADPTAHVEQPFEHSWAHDMGEIVTSIAEAGLRIEFLHEFPFVDWPVPYGERREDGRWYLPKGKGELPLFYSLRATKDR